MLHYANHRDVRERIYKAHPHAHQIGAAAAVIGLFSIPLGQFIVPSLVAIGLGLAAVLLLLHPRQGLNARPEGWAGIGCGLMGLAFGAAQLFIMRSL